MAPAPGTSVPAAWAALLREAQQGTEAARKIYEGALATKKGPGLDEALHQVERRLRAAAGSTAPAAVSAPISQSIPRPAAPIARRKKGASAGGACRGTGRNASAVRGGNGTTGGLAATGPGAASSQELLPLHIVKVKLLVEKAAEAALAGQDSPACRAQVLALLCAAQTEASAALQRHPSLMLYALAGCLMELTAGCSGGALDACLEAWQAQLAMCDLQQQLPLAFSEVDTRQHARAMWPLDPPPGSGTSENALTQVSERAQQAGNQGFDRAKQRLVTASKATSFFSDAGDWRCLRIIQLVRANEAAPERLRRQQLSAIAGQSSSASASGSRSSRSSPGRSQPELAQQGQVQLAELPYKDNERDRTLLQRFGLQGGWLRDQLRRKLASKYPVEPAEAARMLASATLPEPGEGAEQVGDAAAPRGGRALASSSRKKREEEDAQSRADKIRGYLASRLEQQEDGDQASGLEALLAEAAVATAEVLERVAPHLKRHVSKAVQAALQAPGGQLPPVAYLPPPLPASRGSSADSGLLLNQREFEAAFEQCVLDPQAFERQVNTHLSDSRDATSVASVLAKLGAHPRLPQTLAGSNLLSNSCTDGSNVPIPGSVPAVLALADARAVIDWLTEERKQQAAASGHAGAAADNPAAEDCLLAATGVRRGIASRHAKCLDFTVRQTIELASRAAILCDDKVGTSADLGVLQVAGGLDRLLSTMSSGHLQLHAAAAAAAGDQARAVQACARLALSKQAHRDGVTEEYAEVQAIYNTPGPGLNAHAMAMAYWHWQHLLQAWPAGSRAEVLQVKQRVVDGCLLALRLLQTEGRLAGAWRRAILGYVSSLCSNTASSSGKDGSTGRMNSQDLESSLGCALGCGHESGRGRDEAEVAVQSGLRLNEEAQGQDDVAELSWQPLSQLGTLPLDALVPLHGLCCWLVGYCFEDAADHGGRVQEAVAAAESVLQFQGGAVGLCAASVDAAMHPEQGGPPAGDHLSADGFCPRCAAPRRQEAAAADVARALTDVAVGRCKIATSAFPPVSPPLSRRGGERIVEICQSMAFWDGIFEAVVNKVANTVNEAHARLCAFDAAVQRLHTAAEAEAATRSSALADLCQAGIDFVAELDAVAKHCILLKAFTAAVRRNEYLKRQAALQAEAGPATTKRHEVAVKAFQAQVAVPAGLAAAELFEQANQARRDRLAAMLACSKQRGGFRADQMTPAVLCLARHQRAARTWREQLEESTDVIVQDILDLEGLHHAFQRHVLNLRRELQLCLCTVPLHRMVLGGLLRHCLAERWVQAAETRPSTQLLAAKARRAGRVAPAAAGEVPAASCSPEEKAAQQQKAEAELLLQLEEEEAAAARMAAQRKAKQEQRQKQAAVAVLAAATLARPMASSESEESEEEEEEEEEERQEQEEEKQQEHEAAASLPAEQPSSGSQSPRSHRALEGGAEEQGREQLLWPQESQHGGQRQSAEPEACILSSVDSNKGSAPVGAVAAPELAPSTPALLAASLPRHDQQAPPPEQPSASNPTHSPQHGSVPPRCQQSMTGGLPPSAPLPGTQPHAMVGAAGWGAAHALSSTSVAASSVAAVAMAAAAAAAVAAAAPAASQQVLQPIMPGLSTSSQLPPPAPLPGTPAGHVLPGAATAGSSGEGGGWSLFSSFQPGGSGSPRLHSGQGDTPGPSIEGLAARYAAGATADSASGAGASGLVEDGGSLGSADSLPALLGIEGGALGFGGGPDVASWDGSWGVAEGSWEAQGSPWRSHLQGSWQQPLPEMVGGGGGGGGVQLALPGLRNDVGQYNCFLNAVLQCLWRCEAFRQQVLSWPQVFFEAHPVVLALRNLFHQLQGQERAAVGAAALPRPAAVDPAELRLALASSSDRTFGVGEMSDAAEVLLTIYESVGHVAKAQQVPNCVDALAGLEVAEGVYCPTCSLTTHCNQFTQHFYNTQAAAMRDAHAASLQECRLGRMGASSMGKRLRAEQGQLKTCDEDRGGCGRRYPVHHVLRAAPRLFSLQLSWLSTRESGEDIAATLRALDEHLLLGEVYAGQAAAGRRYRLRCMAGFYGQHYVALIRLPELEGQWALFDDSRVSGVGAWEDVVRRCEAVRIQPSVLFYEAVQG